MPEKKKGVIVSFGDVVVNRRDQIQDRKSANIDRIVGLDDIVSGDLRIRAWKGIHESPSFKTHFKPGQTLFGKRRAYLKKVAYADFEGICTQNILVFESKNPSILLPELIPFICTTDAFFKHAIDTSEGSLFPNANWKSIQEFKFLLPLLEEQRQIAKALQAMEFCINNISFSISKAKSMISSAADTLCWKNNFPITPVGNIASEEWGCFRDGDWVEIKDQSKGGIRLIQLSDIGVGEFLNKSEKFITKKTFDKLNCTEVISGDLLISRMADPIGRTCIVPSLQSRCITAVDCCIVRINNRDHDREYWNFALNTQSWTNLVLSKSAGTTRTRISRRNLESIHVPVPSRRQQIEIADILSAMKLAAMKIEIRFCRSIAVKKKFNSLAFQ